MPMRLQGQETGSQRKPVAVSKKPDGADTGDTPALQLRSPALWGPNSHPSASPAAPGTNECLLASAQDPPLQGSHPVPSVGSSPRPNPSPAQLSSYLQLCPSDDIPWVQHIPQGLAHLPALLVPNHGVQKHLGVGGRQWAA